MARKLGNSSKSVKHNIMRTILITLSFFLASCYVCYGQLTFDLSDKSPSEEAIIIKNTAIVFKNLIPWAREKNQYRFVIELKSEEIPAFTDLNLQSDNCDGQNDLSRLLSELTSASDEVVVREKIELLQSRIKKMNSTEQSCIDKIKKSIEYTAYSKPLLFPLKNNQTLTVTVTRKYTDESKVEKEITWTKVFKTPTSSPWLTHFGFTFQPNLLTKPSQYFSSQINEAEGFTIREKNGLYNNVWENLSPTVMFSYPLTNMEGYSHIAFSAIASTNFTNFSAGPGLSIIIGKNVALGTGVMFTQKYYLRGEYRNEQALAEPLNFEQLHEKKWGPEIFFTLGLRFDKNPFGGGGNKENNTESENGNTANNKDE